MEAGGALLVAEVEVVDLNFIAGIVEGSQIILGNTDLLSAEIADDLLDDGLAGPALVANTATNLRILGNGGNDDDAADALLVDQLGRLDRPNNRNRDVVCFAGVHGRSPDTPVLVLQPPSR